MATDNLFSLDNPVMKDFMFYAVVVLIKMMLMSVLTAKQRITNKVFANPEDAAPDAKAKVNLGFEPVERVRRNHLNDLENIIPFVLLGFFYVLTQPAYSTALWVFRIFAGSRIMHTIAYQVPIPQPSRALFFFVGMGINIFMAVKCILHVM